MYFFSFDNNNSVLLKFTARIIDQTRDDDKRNIEIVCY